MTLRLPAPLRNALAKEALASSRSMNGEIVFRLEEFDQLVKQTKELAAMLEKREEALVEDRSRARHLEDILRSSEEHNRADRSRLEEAEAELREARSEAVKLREMLEISDRTIKMFSDTAKQLADPETIQQIAEGVAQALIEAGFRKVD
ncbi:Arc family DNA-binding protein [Mesorhizobium sp. M0179]|uniref:Arc family DNA-binding protein n=1 Tax=Mesorhizobium sp. M0179 TaxID=2956905 RepID=UPI0033391936